MLVRSGVLDVKLDVKLPRSDSASGLCIVAFLVGTRRRNGVEGDTDIVYLY
jgi:hypothetical protein